ncbi:hypothetical protein [Ruminococcus albus]|uniref:Uncharacterized protein n=1 Tax=Ruminococcus albus TaxID=1264 RepID=A0A1I1PYE8_RUMAL|nr:hypothetical protein [Ruminococcus albus]SFD12648.1 hypothetical protein SAMN02910406_03163 [Ruminococcus albus]
MDFDNDDNKITGIIGALIGAALGVGIWCLFGLLGRIAFIGGIAIFLGSFGGYYLLGKGMSKTGLIISAVIIVISVYIATRLNWSIALWKETGISVSECYKILPKLLKKLGERGSFYKELFIGYLITLGGGFLALMKLGVIDN